MRSQRLVEYHIQLSTLHDPNLEVGLNADMFLNVMKSESTHEANEFVIYLVMILLYIYVLPKVQFFPPNVCLRVSLIIFNNSWN